MATLLTGASGFVGRAVARALLARGETVVAFAPDLPFQAAAGNALAQMPFVAGDVRSGDDLRRAIALAAVDRVVHAAALTPDAQTEAEDPARVVAVNVSGTVEVMQAARRAGVSRVLALSSAAIYGAPEDASASLRETETLPRPATLYATTKLASEGVVRRLGELYGIATAMVRLGPCFGVGEYRTGVRPMLSPHWQAAEAALADADCVLPRAMAADWIDVEDAADALSALLALPSLPPGPLNLGGGAATTVASWCEALAGLRPGFRWRIDPEAPTVRYGMVRDRGPMDTARLRDAIGHAPRTDRLPERADRYLRWREGPEGVALCGPAAR